MWGTPTIAGVKTSEAKKMLETFMMSTKEDLKNPHKIIHFINYLNRFFELQYHGELLIDDIASVCFNEHCTFSDEIIKILKNAGIEVYKVEGSKTKKL